MKKNDLKELHVKSLKELEALLSEAKTELAKYRLERETKKLKNLRQVFLQRKKIARLLTVIREKEFTNA